jgi:hypothetical protein
MKRREFLKNSVAASTLIGLSCSGTKSELGGHRADRGKREYYELRVYRSKPGARHELLDSYLQNVAIPTWNSLGINPVGVFSEPEPKGPPQVFVLIPYPNIESFGTTTTKLNASLEQQTHARDYLQAAKSSPAFDRIDSWLMLAFAGMPRLELPAYSRERKPRMFEIRTYESHSEIKALKKIDMFNAGEIDVMREVGLAPVFYGQALVGPNLPHLTYMLSAENRETHKQHWSAFGKHPTWSKMKDDPLYADTVSNISNWYVEPTPYSQI